MGKPLAQNRPHGPWQCCLLRASVRLRDVFPMSQLEHQDHREVRGGQKPLATALCLHTAHPEDVKHRKPSNRQEKQGVYLLTNFPWSAVVSWLALHDKRRGGTWLAAAPSQPLTHYNMILCTPSFRKLLLNCGKTARGNLLQELLTKRSFLKNNPKQETQLPQTWRQT